MTLVKQSTRLMRFRLIDVEIDQYEETEPETAIDISHTTGESTTVTVETSAGLLLSFHESSVRVRLSYIEPDWDLLEQTKQVKYIEHDDVVTPPVCNSSRYAFATLPHSVPPVSSSYFAKQSGNGDVASLLASVQEIWVFPNDNEQDVPFSDNDIFGMLGAALSTPMSGYFWYELPADVEVAVRSLEVQADAIRAANLRARTHNRFSALAFSLGLSLA